MTKIRIANGPAVRQVTVVEFVAMWRAETSRPRVGIANIKTVLDIASESERSVANEAIDYLANLT